jgi:hypothetical protein
VGDGLVYGYIMKNDENGIIIKCTPSFAWEWIKRGFKIIYVGMVDLYD